MAQAATLATEGVKTGRAQANKVDLWPASQLSLSQKNNYYKAGENLRDGILSLTRGSESNPNTEEINESISK